MKSILQLFICVLILSSCNKIEGEGGTSSISGRLIVEDYNGSGVFQSSYFGADEDVYIIYGKDNTVVGDKTTTSFDGSYRFDYLTPGDYKVFAYSDCDSCASGQNEILIDVTISDKKQVAVASDITVKR